jgi:hypothetical protein
MKLNQKEPCAYLTPNKTHPAYLSVPRSTEVMSGYKSRFFSVLMFLAIVCGMSLGENYIFWLFGALFLLMSIMGLTSSGIYEHGEKGQNAALLAQLRDFTPPLATNSLVSPPPHSARRSCLPFRAPDFPQSCPTSGFLHESRYDELCS